MRPLVFADCFGWIHDAPGDCGVVLCGAQGFEQFSAHAGWRELADRIAAQGFPVLRFDYHGSGDSLGTDEDPDRVATWQANIADAVATLRDETGVTRIVLIGLRLGALLALDYAAKAGDVEGLVLLAPPRDGRAYIRELSAFARMSEHKPGTPDAINVMGFELTPQTVAELKAFRAAAPLARRVLILTPSPRTASSERAAQAGVDVSDGPFEGYTEFLSNPTIGETPEDAFARVVAWLGTCPTRAGLPDLVETASVGLATASFVEEPVMFGPDAHLFGMLCQPSDGPSGSAFLLVNAGGNPHTGWARSSVRLARRLAAHGIASFRIDVAGLGDSPAQPGRPAIVPYSADNPMDVQAAIDVLHARGVRQITVLGACSGAHLALQSTLRDRRVSAVVLVNLLCFHWNEKDDLKAALRTSGRSTGAYAARIWTLDSWKRLFAGQLNWSRITGTFVHRVRRVLAVRAELLNPKSQTRQIRRWFSELVTRRASVVFVFTEGDQSIDVFGLHMGEKRLRQNPDAHIVHIPGTDHDLTDRRAQETLATMLLALPAPRAIN
ncbi:MAG: hypothetical protein JWL62_2279 [Hyphomicrobiales bacterium]|nr:hypothetical protein [Hyphomicrobiales bacterium]